MTCNHVFNAVHRQIVFGNLAVVVRNGIVLALFPVIDAQQLGQSAVSKLCRGYLGNARNLGRSRTCNRLPRKNVVVNIGRNVGCVVTNQRSAARCATWGCNGADAQVVDKSHARSSTTAITHNTALICTIAASACGTKRTGKEAIANRCVVGISPSHNTCHLQIGGPTIYSADVCASINGTTFSSRHNASHALRYLSRIRVGNIDRAPNVAYLVVSCRLSHYTSCKMVVCSSGSRHRTRNTKVVDILCAAMNTDECREVGRSIGRNLEVADAMSLSVELACMHVFAVAHRLPQAILEVDVSRKTRISSNVAVVHHIGQPEELAAIINLIIAVAILLSWFIRHKRTSTEAIDVVVLMSGSCNNNVRNCTNRTTTWSIYHSSAIYPKC